MGEDSVELAGIFILLGLALLVGLVADELGRRTRLPRVTILMIVGLVVGRSGFDLVPEAVEQWFEFLSVAALSMVAFLLGSSLTVKSFTAHGRAIISISLWIVVLTTLLVAAGLWALGMDPAVALVLGAIAAATDPAATADALKQARSPDGFGASLRGIVAIDDAWGLIAFSLAMVVANALAGGSDLSFIGTGLWEILGAFLLAAVIGFPAALLTGGSARAIRPWPRRSAWCSFVPGWRNGWRCRS